MKRKKLSAEERANVLLEHRKRGLGAQRIGNKFNFDNSTVTKLFRRHVDALDDGGSVGFSLSGFERVEMPDEGLQGGPEKIAFYKAEAEKYKAAAVRLEKELGLLLRERTAFQSLEIENVVENHELVEIDGKWKMNHDEFMEFFSDFGAT